MATRSHNIAVIAGDGIGPEVIEGAMMVLDVVAEAEDFALQVSHFDLGANRYLKSGADPSRRGAGGLANHDAILLGAVGDPRVPPGVLEKGLLLRLRRELDLYVNLRPARLLPGVRARSRDVDPADLDLLVVRENTEGLYCGLGEVTGDGTPAERATEVSLNTAPAIERIVRYAFEAAAHARSR